MRILIEDNLTPREEDREVKDKTIFEQIVEKLEIPTAHLIDPFIFYTVDAIDKARGIYRFEVSVHRFHGGGATFYENNIVFAPFGRVEEIEFVRWYDEHIIRGFQEKFDQMMFSEAQVQRRQLRSARNAHSDISSTNNLSSNWKQMFRTEKQISTKRFHRAKRRADRLLCAEYIKMQKRESRSRAGIGW